MILLYGAFRGGGGVWHLVDAGGSNTKFTPQRGVNWIQGVYLREGVHYIIYGVLILREVICI